MRAITLAAALLAAGCISDKEGADSGATDSAARGSDSADALVAAVPRIYCADGSEDCAVLEFDGSESEETSDRGIASYAWEINGDALDEAAIVQYDFTDIFTAEALFEGTLTVTDEAGDTNSTGMMMYAMSQTDDCEETGSMVWNKLIKPGFSIGGQCVMQSGLVGGCFNPDQTYAFSWTDATGSETELTAVVDEDRSVIRTTELIDAGTGTLKITKSVCDAGSWVVEDYCFEVTCDPTATFTITYTQVSCSI